MTGVMERTILPGLQQTVGTGGGGYGVAGGGGPITVLVEGTGAGGSTSHRQHQTRDFSDILQVGSSISSVWLSKGNSCQSPGLSRRTIYR